MGWGKKRQIIISLKHQCILKMELFTAVCKQFLYMFMVSMDKIPQRRQVPYGNFRSTYSSFPLSRYKCVLGVNLLQYLWNPASFFTLRKCKQATVATLRINTLVIITSNTAAVVTCPRNSGLGSDSPGTSPEQMWLRCSLPPPKQCHNCLTTNLTIRMMVYPNPKSSNIF